MRTREEVVVCSAATRRWLVVRCTEIDADTLAHTNVIAQISLLNCSDAANVVITYGWLITR